MRQAGRSFLWAKHYYLALATYPEVINGATCSGSREASHVGRRAESARGFPGLNSPGSSPSLFGLAPCGVYPARSIAEAAVRSYRTFSPLPYAVARAWRYFFCGTFRQRSLRIAARTLSGTLLCGVRTFLPSTRAAWTHPAFAGQERPSGPAVNPLIIVDVSGGAWILGQCAEHCLAN